MAKLTPRLRNLLTSLIVHGKVETSEARAKNLKKEVERLISRSKKLDLVARRRILALLPDKTAAVKLFEQIVPQFKDRVGGYVRIVKLPPRLGDNAPMARVEFVEEIKTPPEEEKPKAKPKARTKKAVVKKTAVRAKKKDAKNKSNKSK
ncbi:50S ribosomal protein L17 [Candidatus Saccharibacteria bacterium]|nr:50S ribosomal protein L17 [Candidatus Saccharibacteria bacterium]